MEFVLITINWTPRVIRVIPREKLEFVFRVYESMFTYPRLDSFEPRALQRIPMHNCLTFPLFGLTSLPTTPVTLLSTLPPIPLGVERVNVKFHTRHLHSAS